MEVDHPKGRNEGFEKKEMGWNNGPFYNIGLGCRARMVPDRDINFKGPMGFEVRLHHHDYKVWRLRKWRTGVFLGNVNLPSCLQAPQRKFRLGAREKNSKWCVE